ncbi:hypothetical protein GCM10009733_097980 [Nonomuraea maheshkhaliensis]|uniref:Uncharacterized protein n=1 Tax=Nonomuraea maheshkhaliensis TaxID=419590 RepID=A0ABN2HCP6_9ACTN
MCPEDLLEAADELLGIAKDRDAGGQLRFHRGQRDAQDHCWWVPPWHF